MRDPRNPMPNVGDWGNMVGKQTSGTPSQGIANVANETMMIPNDGVASNGCVGIWGLTIGLMIAVAHQIIDVFWSAYFSADRLLYLWKKQCVVLELCHSILFHCLVCSRSYGVLGCRESSRSELLCALSSTELLELIVCCLEAVSSWTFLYKNIPSVQLCTLQLRLSKLVGHYSELQSH